MAARATCAACGRAFVSLGALIAHKRRRGHRWRVFPKARRDAFAEPA